jgi:large subunit GTPase 1
MPRSQGTSRKGKPKKNERAAGMGRALQRAQPHKHKSKPSQGGMSMTPGVDSINIHKEEVRASVLEMNDLDDFLVQAEMANREFASEREQMVILDATAQAAKREEASKKITWSDQPVTVTDPFAFQELSVPRRPLWDETTTPEELDKSEKDSFLDWRRAIAQKEEQIILQSSSSLGVTPFEKNLEIWRQLWRVMERSSCIVQIVDARNPLFYLSQDLKKYATEELGKPMLLLVNKSDYLTPKQRQAWHEYLSHPDHKWDHIFFSAHEQQARLDHEAAEQIAAEEEIQNPALPEDDDSDDDDNTEIENRTEEDKLLTEKQDKIPSTLDEEKSGTPILQNLGIEKCLSSEALLDWLHAYALEHDCLPGLHHNRMAFGMVGFPNVGKSSVINVLMGNASNAHGVVRVAVASQPGKTKHFQTLLLPTRSDMLLCDCPGLVFPSFVNNTADLIAAGVYPIAQMRDHWPVVTLLCQRIPREVLNAYYGIQIPLPSPDAMMEVKNGKIPSPTAEEFLTTYCVARSMLAASSGVPDYTRASRFVIKDYADGRLLYCHTPPTCEHAGAFQRETLIRALYNTKKLREKLLKKSQVSKEIENAAEPVEDGEENEVNLEDDDMLLELMGGTSLGQVDPSANAEPTRKKKWGKKGRKLRNKDPYGCHSTPDGVLSDSTSTKLPVGVSVSAGKYGRQGYTRPTGFGGARSAG